jgi:hypothetical protein
MEVPEYVWVVTAQPLNKEPIISVYVSEEKAQITYKIWKELESELIKVTLTKTYLFS